MGTLIYSATVSLDGYVADADGGIDWGAPSAEVFAVHLERIAAVSTEVLGRRTHALMEYWDTFPESAEHPDAEEHSADEVEFGRRWRGIDIVVVSSTLTQADLTSERMRLVTELDLDELRRIVERASGMVEIFGPTTAAEAIRAGLVEEFHLFVAPTVLGGGLRALPADAQLDLQLVEHRIFDSGTVFLRYRRR